MGLGHLDPRGDRTAGAQRDGDPALHDLPKTELHQHLGGSIPVELTFRMLTERGMAPVATRDALEPLLVVQADEEGSAPDYFRKHQLPLWATQYAENLTRAARRVAGEAHRQGVTELELRCSPQLHVHLELSLAEVIGAVLRGLDAARRDAPALRAELIVSAVRQLGPDAAARLAAAAVAAPAPGRARVVGFDLGGAERGNPAAAFRLAFDAARAGGLGLTAHAGEEDAAASIWAALDVLGATRIGHGCSALHDPELLRRLARDRVLVECCHTSNRKTGAVARGARPTLLGLLERGIPVAICTDNATVGDTDATRETALYREWLSLAELGAIHRDARAHRFGGDRRG